MSVHCAQMESYIGAICSRECVAVVSLKGCRRTWLERVFVPAQVAHAYLHAESTPAGRLDDGSIVAQVAKDLLPVPTTHYAMPFTEWRCILT